MQKNKYLVINSRKNGFFSNFLHTVDSLIYAKNNGYTPILNWGYDQTFLYKDESFENETGINDCWSYYFKPINLLKLSDVEKDSEVVFKNDFSNPPLVPYCFRGVNAHGNHKIDLETFRFVRTGISEFIEQNISLRKPIQEKIDTFYQDNFLNKKILSMHIRGTDRWTEMKDKKLSKYENYEIILSDHIDNYDRVFLCTDSEETLEYFSKNYKKVFFYNSFRSDNHYGKPIHFFNGNYKTGEDVLCETYLMSKSDFLIKSDSNVTLSALYINKNLNFEYYNYENLCV